MLHEITKSWLGLVAVHVDLASRRTRSEPIDADLSRATLGAAAALSRRTRGVDGLIATMASRLGLSLEEELAAWTLVATQLDRALATRLEVLSGGPEVTKGALAAVAYASHPARAVRDLAASAALFRYGLVEHVDATTTSWARRAIRATERMLSLALVDADARPTGCDFLRPDRQTPPVDELAIAATAAAELRRAVRGDSVVIAAGLPGAGKRTALTAIAREAGLELLEVDVRALSDDPIEFSMQLRSLARECRLRQRVPLLGNLDAIADAKLQHVALVGSELAPQLAGPILATAGGRCATFAWHRPVVAIDLPPPTFAQRATLWLTSLGAGRASDGERLATQYPLAPGLIVRAASAAAMRAAADPVTPADIAAGVRATLDDRLGPYARRVRVTQTWADLVLPPDHVDVVTELLARARERRRVYEDWGFATKLGKGLGISALFSGPPGTGKSMVAALVAKELELELYQVDLASIVSKWIGETEKQLAALFDAAESTHAILLFDEADSLFGKRTDVKSSNDRYANLETNYLLQRLETFDGICLLTTNHESAVDPAFLRRLSLHLRFSLPAEDERARLWKAMLPAEAPVAPDLDVSALAHRYDMSGGYIRNAALRAAFLAADRDEVIDMTHLERAARLEYEAMGKLAA